MLSHPERGKLGSKTLWNRYRTDTAFHDKLLKKWKESRIKNYKKSVKSLPKLSKKETEILKSRLCGFLVADGSVFIRKESKTGKVHYEIRFYPDHYTLVELFNKTFQKLYGKEANVKQSGRYFTVSVTNKVAVMDLLSVSKFTSIRWTLPKILNSRKAKVEWLRAYFDCDGYIGKKYIQVQSVNKKGLESIQKLLEGFGIITKIYAYKRKEKSWNTNYLLNINRRDMCFKFLKEIGFNHILKRKKLHELLLNAGVA